MKWNSFNPTNSSETVNLGSLFEEEGVTGYKFVHRSTKHEKSCFAIINKVDDKGNTLEWSLPMDTAFKAMTKAELAAISPYDLSIIGDDEEGWVIIHDGGLTTFVPRG